MPNYTPILKNIDLVILAGGKGLRIFNFLGKYPKPMIKINDKHFIQYVLNISTRFNFKRIFILCGYRSRFIFKKFHNKIINLTKIICIKEKKLLGTGGALNKLKKFKVKDFVLINGDTIFNINILELISSLDKKNIGIVALTKNKKQQSKKLNKLIIKNKLLYNVKKSSLMNGGIYFFQNKIFKYISKRYISLENNILPKLIEEKKIQGKIFNDFFIDIGSEHYLKLAKKKLISEFKRPAAFLDRDGVINYDYGHVYKFKDFKFRDGVIDGLKYLIKNKFWIFIVTNQAGIGKKFYSEKEFILLHKTINEKLKKENIFINDVQYSPFHKDSLEKRYKKNSLMRKPGNKMINNIKLNWDLDLKRSFMIGDKVNDKIAAKKSNIKFFFSKDNFYNQVKSIVSNY